MINGTFCTGPTRSIGTVWDYQFIEGFLLPELPYITEDRTKLRLKEFYEMEISI